MQPTPRDQLVSDWVASRFPDQSVQITTASADASFRRYFRLTWPDGTTRILMDAPPPQEDPRPFIDIARWLVGRGFAAPQIYGEDLNTGLVLIEDFGDARLRETVDAAPESELRLYEAAIDVLVRLREHGAADVVGPYDRDVYQREAALLTEWYCPAVGLDVDVEGYIAAWDAVLAPALDGAPVTVLRDYHAENLMLIEGRETFGLLDFQDALAGHPAYDLVSLLQDARRDVHPDLEAALLDLAAARGEAATDRQVHQRRRLAEARLHDLRRRARHAAPLPHR